MSYTEWKLHFMKEVPPFGFNSDTASSLKEICFNRCKRHIVFLNMTVVKYEIVEYF